jgi:hypothetical protein
VFIAMELDWTSTRTAAAVEPLLSEMLPRVIAGIIGEYAHVCVPEACKFIRNRILTWHPPLLDVCTFGVSSLSRRGEFYIGFVRGGKVVCEHIVYLHVRDVWDFACGEPISIITNIIKYHTLNATEIADCLRAGRIYLRNEIRREIGRGESRSTWNKWHD